MDLMPPPPLLRVAHERGWREKHSILIGAGGPEYPGEYGEHLSRSKFCLVVPGGQGGGRRTAGVCDSDDGEMYGWVDEACCHVRGLCLCDHCRR